jgi:hypothetical protein
MSMSTRDYMRAAEAYLNDVVAAKRANERASKRIKA